MAILKNSNILDEGGLSGSRENIAKKLREQDLSNAPLARLHLESLEREDPFRGKSIFQVTREEMENYLNSNDLIGRDEVDQEEKIIRDAFDETMKLQNKVNKVAKEYNLPKTQETQSQAPTTQSTEQGSANGFNTGGNSYSTQMMPISSGSTGVVVDKVVRRKKEQEEEFNKAQDLGRELNQYDAYYDTTDEILSPAEYLRRFYNY